MDEDPALLSTLQSLENQESHQSTYALWLQILQRNILDLNRKHRSFKDDGRPNQEYQRPDLREQAHGPSVIEIQPANEEEIEKETIATIR